MRTGSSFADRLAFLAAKMRKRRKRNQQGAVHHSFVAFVSFCEEAIATVASPVSVQKTTKLTKDCSGCPAMDLLLGEEQPCEGLFSLRFLRFFAANQQLHSARMVVCGLWCCG